MNEEFEALVLAVISEIPCGPVSYTHLDVYKRQDYRRTNRYRASYISLL